jgi:hypothetical protein
MKKIMAAALIAVLALGTFLSLVAASPLPTVLDDDEDDDEWDEDEETNEEDEADEQDDDDEADDEDDESDERDDDDGDDDEDDDEDGIDDDKELREERKLEIETSETKAKVESEIETEDMENEIEIEFMAEEGVSIELKYKNETETDEEEIEAELELKVQFLNIVEYFDNDTSGNLTDGDTRVQTLDLEELRYSRPEVTTVTSVDGETGYRFELIGTLDDFEFNITAVFFSSYALVDNTLVGPTETKITINITNFPFNDTTGTSALALQVKATSEMEIEKETETTESEVKVKSQKAEGYFSWENWAIVDGVNRAVNHSLTKTSDSTLINLCYPGASKIVHDPKLGVWAELPPVLTYVFTLITPELIAATGILAIAITVATVALSRGKKTSPASLPHTVPLTANETRQHT